ncbi:hypothetical protein [Deinococcus apachensis]|uniref:hypothetical protein n=1 Tax=Deinococcus apachensis TaxID=309886 RepID=UPI0003671333|nr:hypothetical protein [Deinococcus apachensis]
MNHRIEQVLTGTPGMFALLALIALLLAAELRLFFPGPLDRRLRTGTRVVGTGLALLVVAQFLIRVLR